MEYRLNKFESVFVFVFVLVMLLRYHVVFVLAQQLTFNYIQTDAHIHLYIVSWPLFLLTIYGIAHKLMNKLFCVVVLRCVLAS